MPLNHQLDYSIVICSFNPDERILKRCLHAVSNLNFTGLSYEIILVDNNSTPSLSTLPYVQKFLTTSKHSRCIVAHEQGLTPARIKGIDEAQGDYLVFFDDDNEPEKDYLINLKTLHADYPSVAAWGPGNIWVDFIDGINDNVGRINESLIREIFQERHENHVTYGNVRHWQSYYPYGTGLCIKHNFLKKYASKVKNNEYSAIDRKGNSLSSGGDLQMVLFCISRSAAAGVSPTLKTNHLISKEKANFSYLKKLTFGTTLSYHISTKEIIKEHGSHVLKTFVSPLRFQRKALIKYIPIVFTKDQTKTLKLIKFIGVTCGSYLVTNTPIPKLVFRILNALGIDTKNLPT